jgi:hypothetical protein
MFLKWSFDANIFLYRMFQEGRFDANICWHDEEKTQQMNGYIRRLKSNNKSAKSILKN